MESRTTKVEVVKGLGDNGNFDPQAIYDRLAPGVVTITSIFGSGGGRNPLEEEGEGGQGSGFVLDSQGFVATNAHVVTTGSPRTRRARQVFVGFSDGNRVPARIVGTDPFADVAVLKIDPRGLQLTPLTVGNSRDVKVGEPVAAIGSPFGEEQSLSVGVISAVDRSIESLTQFADRQRDPDRRRHQPRQLGRPAALGEGAGPGHQRADPLAQRRRRGRRIRDPGRRGAALDPRAPGAAAACPTASSGCPPSRCSPSSLASSTSRCAAAR